MKVGYTCPQCDAEDNEAEVDVDRQYDVFTLLGAECYACKYSLTDADAQRLLAEPIHNALNDTWPDPT